MGAYEQCYKLCESDSTCGCFSVVRFETDPTMSTTGYQCNKYPLFSRPYTKSSYGSGFTNSKDVYSYRMPDRHFGSCAHWCDEYTCGKDECSGCSVCAGLEAEVHCSWWCNVYT